jgi:hypothetical protein
VVVFFEVTMPAATMDSTAALALGEGLEVNIAGEVVAAVVVSAPSLTDLTQPMSSVVTDPSGGTAGQQEVLSSASSSSSLENVGAGDPLAPLFMGAMTNQFFIGAMVIGLLLLGNLLFCSFVIVRRRISNVPRKGDEVEGKAKGGDEEPKPVVFEFKARLDNMDYEKLIADPALFAGTQRLVASELAERAGVHEDDVIVRLLPGSVRVHAEVRVPSSVGAAALGDIRADLNRPSTGGELLASLVTQTGFSELKEDPHKVFTISAVSVAEMVADAPSVTRESDRGKIDVPFYPVKETGEDAVLALLTDVGAEGLRLDDEFDLDLTGDIEPIWPDERTNIERGDGVDMNAGEIITPTTIAPGTGTSVDKTIGLGGTFEDHGLVIEDDGLVFEDDGRVFGTQRSKKVGEELADVDAKFERSSGLFACECKPCTPEVGAGQVAIAVPIVTTVPSSAEHAEGVVISFRHAEHVEEVVNDMTNAISL